jgi:hypothetical protein
VTDVQASADPCVGQRDLHVLAWYTRQGTRYPLRCGHRDPAGWGYSHIRYDEGGHGDPVNDSTFSAEMANTLEYGQEALSSGGTWRYTVKTRPRAPATWAPGASEWSWRGSRRSRTATPPVSSRRSTTPNSRPDTHNLRDVAHAIDIRGSRAQKYGSGEGCECREGRLIRRWRIDEK